MSLGSMAHVGFKKCPYHHIGAEGHINSAARRGQIGTRRIEREYPCGALEGWGVLMSCGPCGTADFSPNVYPPPLVGSPIVFTKGNTENKNKDFFLLN